MDRPSFDRIYMNLASQLAERSTCIRLKVGSVITSLDYRKVLSVGYNGTGSGMDHNCTGEEGNCLCLHSEINAIINCDAPRETKKIFFVTHYPCVMCYKAIVNLGNVEEVIYKNPYRTMTDFGKLKVRKL